MPAARRHADVEVDAVHRHRLQQMEDVEAQLERRSRRRAVFDLDVAVFPEVLPGALRARPAATSKRPAWPTVAACFEAGLGDRTVARGVQRRRSSRPRSSRPARTVQAISCVIWSASCCVCRSASSSRSSPSWPSSPYRRVRAAWAIWTSDWLVRQRRKIVSAPSDSSRQHVEVPAGQVAVARDAVVAHAAVQAPSAPSAGPDQSSAVRSTHSAGQVRLGHADDAAFVPAGRPARRIAQAQVAVQHASAEIELLPERQQLDLVEPEPVAVVDPERQRQPVRQVDEILVLDPAAGDFGRLRRL